MADSAKDEFLDHLLGEARYGLNRSHQSGQHSGRCNAQEALQIIITAIRQRLGEEVENPIGWAKSEATDGR